MDDFKFKLLMISCLFMNKIKSPYGVWIQSSHGNWLSLKFGQNILAGIRTFKKQSLLSFYLILANQIGNITIWALMVKIFYHSTQIKKTSTAKYYWKQKMQMKFRN